MIAECLKRNNPLNGCATRSCLDSIDPYTLEGSVANEASQSTGESV